MTVTSDQAVQLATLACAMRPHGARRWDTNGVIHFIRKIEHLNLADVTMAVARAASDRTLHTPAAIADLRSSAWRERLTQGPTHRQQICATHGVQRNALGICPSCRADALAGDHVDHEGTPA